MRLIIASSCLFIFLLYLVIEKFYLSTIINDIPVRICITGTRGKSSVVRLVHSTLNQNGFRTLGKTTGSQPSLLLPDGSEEEIYRRGPQSILEQRKILRKAHRYDVDAYVIEMMGIKPEYKFAESTKILKPNILGVTKITLDHISAMGDSKKAISEAIAVSVPSDASVVARDKNFLNHSSQLLKDSEVVRLEGSKKNIIKKVLNNMVHWEFEENVRLALSIAGQVNIPPEKAAKGMYNTKPDIGSLRAWSLTHPGENYRMTVVNAFAANDPESTKLVLNKAMTKLSIEGKPLAGLLNLRKDRAARTLQWKEAMTEDLISSFDRIYVTGDQNKKFEKLFSDSGTTVRGVEFSHPENLTSRIFQELAGEAVIFGFGNIKGPGKRLVQYWSNRGEII